MKTEDRERLVEQARAELAEITEQSYRVCSAYRFGSGTANDDDTVAGMFELGAKLGHAKSQCRTGRMFMEGVGRPQDLVRAYTWFSVAVAQGNGDAREGLWNLQNRMPPELIAQAQQELARFLLEEYTTISAHQTPPRHGKKESSKHSSRPRKCSRKNGAD